MSSGCIVFLSNIPNHVELVDDGVNGFIFDLETNKLSNKIKTVLDNNYDLKQISNNSINTTREKFNLQKFLIKKMKIINFLKIINSFYFTEFSSIVIQTFSSILMNLSLIYTYINC